MQSENKYNIYLNRLRLVAGMQKLNGTDYRTKRVDSETAPFKFISLFDGFPLPPYMEVYSRDHKHNITYYDCNRYGSR